MEMSDSWNNWPGAGWWKRMEERAKGMSLADLHYARLDCFKAGQANPERQGYYLDEGSVYAMEQKKRYKRGET